jgi:hypothetical protein
LVAELLYATQFCSSATGIGRHSVIRSMPRHSPRNDPNDSLLKTFQLTCNIHELKVHKIDLLKSSTSHSSRNKWSQPACISVRPSSAVLAIISSARTDMKSARRVERPAKENAHLHKMSREIPREKINKIQKLKETF